MVTLVTGGARSGKSSYALSRVREGHQRPVFIATAQAFDAEMRERISRHKAERGERFQTIEEPLDLSRALRSLPTDTDIVIVDCLTVWLGNLYHFRHENVDEIKSSIDLLINDLRQFSGDLILVTNEVGWGIVPENEMARSFRDVAGFLNRGVAEVACEVVLCVCGVPMKIK